MANEKRKCEPAFEVEAVAPGERAGSQQPDIARSSPFTNQTDTEPRPVPRILPERIGLQVSQEADDTVDDQKRTQDLEGAAEVFAPSGPGLWIPFVPWEGAVGVEKHCSAPEDGRGAEDLVESHHDPRSCLLARRNHREQQVGKPLLSRSR